jgi:hypothetical protein
MLLIGTSPPKFNEDPAYYGEELYRKTLKAPTTAKFSETKVTELAPNIYRVCGLVDAQNSFGVMIRDRWSLVVKHEANKWRSLEDYTPPTQPTTRTMEPLFSPTATPHVYKLGEPRPIILSDGEEHK